MCETVGGFLTITRYGRKRRVIPIKSNGRKKWKEKHSFFLSNDFSSLVTFLHDPRKNDLIDPRVISYLGPRSNRSWTASAFLWDARYISLHHYVFPFRSVLSTLISLYPSVFLSCCHSRGNVASTYARLATTFSSACAKRNDGPQATIEILMFYFFLFCRLSQSTKLHPRVLITSIAKTQRGKFSRVSSLLACTPTRCMP